jgi:hypothetical protein
MDSAEGEDLSVRRARLAHWNNTFFHAQEQHGDSPCRLRHVAIVASVRLRVLPVRHSPTHKAHAPPYVKASRRLLPRKETQVDRV